MAQFSVKIMRLSGSVLDENQHPTLLPGEQGTVSVSMRGYGGHAAVGLGAAMRLGDSNTQLFGSMGATKSHAGGTVGLRLGW